MMKITKVADRLSMGLSIPILLQVDEDSLWERELAPPIHPGLSLTFVIPSQRHTADRLLANIAEKLLTALQRLSP
eukprot:262185-Pleurochrysis_carterae.AAC.1